MGAMVEDTIGKWLQGSNFKTAGHKADADSDQFNVLIDLAKGWPRMIIDDVSPLRSIPRQWRVVLEPSGALKARGKEVISELFIGGPLDAGDARRLNGLLSLMSMSHLTIGKRASIKEPLSLQLAPDEIGEARIDMVAQFLKGVQNKVLDLRVREDSLDDLSNIVIATSDMPLSQMMVPLKKGYITIEGLPAAPSESITIQADDTNIAENIGDLLLRNNDGIISLNKHIWEIPSKDTPWDVSALGQTLDHVLWEGPRYDLSQHLSIILISDPRNGSHYTVEIHNKRRKRTKALSYTICIHSQIRPEITYRISEM